MNMKANTTIFWSTSFETHCQEQWIPSFLTAFVLNYFFMFSYVLYIQCACAKISMFLKREIILYKIESKQ